MNDKPVGISILNFNEILLLAVISHPYFSPVMIVDIRAVFQFVIIGNV